jgi:hypothetical protein
MSYQKDENGDENDCAFFKQQSYPACPQLADRGCPPRWMVVRLEYKS